MINGQKHIDIGSKAVRVIKETHSVAFKCNMVDYEIMVTLEDGKDYKGTLSIPVSLVNKCLAQPS